MLFRSTLRSLVPVVLVSLLASAGCEQSENSKKAVEAHHTKWDLMKTAVFLDGAERDIRAGDLDRALNSTERLINEGTKNPKVYVLAGRCHLEKGNLERAAILLRTALDMDDQLPEAHFYLGNVHQRWRNVDEAETHYRLAYELRKDDVTFLLPVAEILVAQGKSSEALQLLKSKEVYFESNSGIYMAIGQIHFARREFKEASHYLERASVMQPEDDRLKEELARAQMASRDIKGAIRTYEQLLKKEKYKDRKDIRIELAKAYIAGDRFRDAKQFLMKMSRTDPKDAQVWSLLGDIAWATEDISGALYIANRLIRVAPERPEGYLLGGMVWQKRGVVDKALDNFDRAAELAPDDATPLILRGITLQNAGRKAEAAKAYREASRRQPNDERATRLLVAVQSNH